MTQPEVHEGLLTWRDMATIERQLISQTHWRTDGVTTNFSFSFLNGYISQQHIKCRLRDPVSGLERAVTPVRGTSSVSITPAPANGWLLVIYRDTPFTPLVNFSDTTSLDEEDLTLLVRQAMFAAQEARDWSDSQLARFAEGLGGDNQLTVQLLALVEQAQAALTQATQVAAGVTADAAGIEASANQVQASERCPGRARRRQRLHGRRCPVSHARQCKLG